jgi:hypothetical protein
MKNWMIAVLSFFAICLIGAAAFFLGGQEPPPIEKTATVTLDIRASPTFNLAVTPANIISYPNRVVAYNIVCTGVNNFAGVITLTASGLGTGMTAQFLPSATFTLGLTPAGAQMNVTVPDDQALVKIHTLTIKARSVSYN